MRVLHVVTRFAQGGSERDILHQLRWEQARGFEVGMVVGGALAPPALEGVSVHRAPALIQRHNPLADLRALAQLRSILRRVAPDVVITHQSKAGVLGRLAARGVARRVMHTVHMASFGPGYSPLSSRVQAAAERYCGTFTDLVVCVGEELCARYVAHGVGAPERYAIMRTPVEIDRFGGGRRLSEAARASLRARLGLTAGRPLAVAIGALEPRKRHALMLAELAPLLRGEAAILALAGDGPLRAALEQQARELGIDGSVRLLGQIARTEDLLACADVLVLASRVEGVPRVVIEALAAGVPIVATDVEGLREVPDAPIAIVPRSGAGLGAAVEEVLGGPRPADVPLSALDAWRPAAVDAQLESIFQRLIDPAARREAVARGDAAPA